MVRMRFRPLPPSCRRPIRILNWKYSRAARFTKRSWSKQAPTPWRASSPIRHLRNRSMKLLPICVPTATISFGSPATGSGTMSEATTCGSVVSGDAPLPADVGSPVTGKNSTAVSSGLPASGVRMQRRTSSIWTYLRRVSRTVRRAPHRQTIISGHPETGYGTPAPINGSREPGVVTETDGRG